MEKQLTIIVVIYNSKDVADKCLQNIVCDDFEIIIVDNASSDGAAEFLKQKYNVINVINSGGNLGYGRAANIGLKATNTEYALLMNPDVMTSKEAITELLNRARSNKSAAICAPRTEKDIKLDSGSVDWISGSVMLFNMKKIKDVGLFDENIFLFYEETDICKRTKKKGYEILLFNDIYFDHRVGKSSVSSDKTNYLKYWHGAWSKFYFNKKYYSKNTYIRKSLGYILKFSVKYIKASFFNDRSNKMQAKASLAGALNGIFGLKAFDKNGKPRGLINH